MTLHRLKPTDDQGRRFTDSRCAHSALYLTATKTEIGFVEEMGREKINNTLPKFNLPSC